MFTFHTLGEAFSELFTGMSVSVFMCIITGMMLVIIEFYCTSKGLIGSLGAVLIGAGVLIRMLFNGSFAVLFSMLFLIILILFAAQILMLATQKKNWLVHSLSIALQSSGKGSDYNYLKNLTGVATTDINPSGHIAIGEINFFVSAPEFIEKGSLVRVVEADGEKIVVKQISEYFISERTNSTTLTRL